MKLRFIEREIIETRRRPTGKEGRSFLETRTRMTRVLQYEDENTGEWLDVPLVKE